MLLLLKLRNGTSLECDGSTRVKVAGNKYRQKTELVAEAEIKTLNIQSKKEITLGNIAKNLALLADLKEWNQLSDQNIVLGKVLIVAKMKLPSIQPKLCRFIQKKDNAAVSKKGIDYCSKGDSLYSIAKKHPGITISDIKSGTIFEMKKIKPGMKLKN
jgi:membrane-bound lytic murein transglycosylase D